MKKLENLQELDQEDLQKEELLWLKSCIRTEFEKGVSEGRINFSATKKKHLVHIQVSKRVRENAPSRFLKSKFVVDKVPGNDMEGPWVKLELLYWYIENIDDIWGYKKLLDTLFYLVFYKKEDYNKESEGYMVLVEHIKKVTKGWRSIKRTLLIGYMYYLKLCQDSSVIPLKAINEGLKDKSLKVIGLTIASKESFGKVTHYSKLNTCWNCGDEIEDTRSGMCMDCLDYWDRKTR